MTRRKPKALKPGSQIRIVSPASSLTPEKIARGVQILESEGYRVSLAPHVFSQKAYLAGTDPERASDLMDAFRDPDIDCVFCSRGGYGCARLLPLIDLDEIAASDKMFCGFSDITTLHTALNNRGLVTYHTPMLITLGTEREPWVESSFRSLLKGENPFPQEAKKAETLVGGKVEGTLGGGCLILLADSLGTSEAFDATGKIVLLEDVDENPHRVDAMLTHLLNEGTIRKAKGILVGEMTGTDERADPTIGPLPWREIVADRLIPLGIPLAVNFPFGHMKTMLSVPFGVTAVFDADAGTLELTESPCA
ncbi:MAG: LD-carboxypeptidase [Fimbriimonadaceae bacterium]|jgi:muramoyltetrapeptide carboxypeptidase|nr:LD-carboxypeptidase [Fimbriimonadaceae bacterium]